MYTAIRLRPVHRAASSAGGINDDGTIFELTGVLRASTTTTASNVTATFSPNAQNVTLTANVSSGSGSVNEGTVTFTILQGSTVVGTATTSNTVSNGHASVSYASPASLAAGTYTIDAVYNNGPDFGGSSDMTHTLTILLAPTVTTNPTNEAVTEAQTATFTAAASGNPSPTVQWQLSSDSGKTWTDISGATSTTLTLDNVSLAMNGNEYQAVFANSSGNVTTRAATLAVNAPPTPPVLHVPPLLAFLDSLFRGMETVNANGTETMTDSFFGIALIVSTFDSHGDLTSVDLFGFTIPNWVWFV